MMFRVATILLATAPLCCRTAAVEAAMPDDVAVVSGDVEWAVETPMAGDPVACDPVVSVPVVSAERFRGTVAEGRMRDHWVARSTGDGWNLVALPSTPHGPLDLWFGVAHKSADLENYDFTLFRWSGLRVVEAQRGVLYGGTDEQGARRRDRRPWRAECFLPGLNAPYVESGELLLTTGEVATIEGSPGRGVQAAID